MAWARLDDAFWRNPKVLAAGNEAAGLYARALSYAADNETAGLLTIDTVKTLAGGRWKTLSAKLTSAELWDDLGPAGWHIHDYDDPAYGNPATAKARARTEAAKKAAAARWNNPPPDPDAMRTASETHSLPHTEPHSSRIADPLPLRAQAGASQSQSPVVGSSLRDGPELSNAGEDRDHHEDETEHEAREQLVLAVHALQPSWQLSRIRDTITKARQKTAMHRVVTALLIVAAAKDSTSPRRILSHGYWWDETDSRYTEALASPRLTEVLEAAS